MLTFTVSCKVIAAKRKQIPENIQLMYMTMLFDAMVNDSLPAFL